MKGKKSSKVCCISAFIAIVIAAAVIAVVVAVIVVLSTRGSSGTESQSNGVSYQLHVNPADPVILSAETPEGDLISMLGNKSVNGEPQTIDQFLLENEDELTSVFMNNDGSIESAQGNDGFNIDFIWDENETTIYTSIVINNGSQQLSIRVNLSEPVGENLTSFMPENIDSNITSKRSLNNDEVKNWLNSNTPAASKIKVKRQSNSNGESSHASVFVGVQSCNGPESNARVFADVLLGYDQDSGNYEHKAKYWGAKSLNPGEYEIQIPTSKASMVGEKIGNVCDKINMILGKVCEFYSKANEITQLVSRHDADSVFCFFLGKGLHLAFPALRLIPVYRFCRNIFKPLKVYCNKADADLPGTDISPVDLICDALPLVDNGIDLLKEKDIFFTPTAIIPPGNHVQGTGQVLSLQPGVNVIPQRFTIVDNDQGQLRITNFNVIPFDPFPEEDYIVIVTYNCYSSSTFFANMSIVGTDNYTDYNVCYTGPTCILHVPGAEALVRDDVLIYIQNNQTAVSRMVVVIF